MRRRRARSPTFGTCLRDDSLANTRSSIRIAATSLHSAPARHPTTPWRKRRDRASRKRPDPTGKPRSPAAIPGSRDHLRRDPGRRRQTRRAGDHRRARTWRHRREGARGVDYEGSQQRDGREDDRDSRGRRQHTHRNAATRPRTEHDRGRGGQAAGRPPSRRPRPARRSVGLMARGLLSSDPSVRSASVDLVSNHTVFRDQEHFRPMLIDDPLPASTYSSFVHEATHHWCSTSPLGTALSLLFLRAGRGVLRWARSGEDSGLSDSLAAYATFQIAITWLRPLHEGLAQFAEYDVRPNLFGPGRLDSPPVVAAMFYLFDIEARANKAQWDDQRRAYYELLDDIDRWRLSPATVDRKAELLLPPIAAESRAYLLGYLTIKQLYRQARRAQPQLEHADAFMILVRKLVFGDYALVGVILDDSRSPLERGLELGRRLHQRLQVIRTALSAQDRSWKQLEELLMPSKEVTELGVLKLVDAEPYAMYPED